MMMTTRRTLPPPPDDHYWVLRSVSRVFRRNTFPGDLCGVKQMTQHRLHAFLCTDGRSESVVMTRESCAKKRMFLRCPKQKHLKIPFTAPLRASLNPAAAFDRTRARTPHKSRTTHKGAGGGAETATTRRRSNGIYLGPEQNEHKLYTVNGTSRRMPLRIAPPPALHSKSF